MKRQPITRSTIFLKLLLLFLLVVNDELFAAEQLKVPLHLDYPLLERLMTNQLFGGPGQRLEILHETRGCNKMFISDVSLREHRRTMAINIHIDGHGSAMLSQTDI